MNNSIYKSVSFSVPTINTTFQQFKCTGDIDYFRTILKDGERNKFFLVNLLFKDPSGELMTVSNIANFTIDNPNYFCNFFMENYRIKFKFVFNIGIEDGLYAEMFLNKGSPITNVQCQIIYLGSVIKRF